MLRKGTHFWPSDEAKATFVSTLSASTRADPDAIQIASCPQKVVAHSLDFISLSRKDFVQEGQPSNTTGRRLASSVAVVITIKQRTAEEAALTLEDMDAPRLHSAFNMGGCQNYDPFLGSLHIRCRIIFRIQKGTIILTTTHMRVCCSELVCMLMAHEVDLLSKELGNAVEQHPKLGLWEYMLFVSLLAVSGRVCRNMDSTAN